MNYLADFNARLDLINEYHHNALLLYALQLKFEISDIMSVASDALTDGGNDKKCDLIYVDPDNGVAVIAQAYMKQDFKDTDLAPVHRTQFYNNRFLSWSFQLTWHVQTIPWYRFPSTPHPSPWPFP